MNCCIQLNKKATNFEITEMVVDDLNEVMAIERSSFVTPLSEEMFRRELRSPAFCNLVAKKGREVVGFINFFLIDIGEVHIMDIAVREDFRTQGIASKLMEAMIKTSYYQGCLRATLEMRRHNTAARKLYEKFGFVVEGVRPLYYSDTSEDALIMWADVRESLQKIARASEQKIQDSRPDP